VETRSRASGRARSALLLAAAGVVLASLLGCATASKPGGMKPAGAARLASEPAGSVDISVTGGRETFPLGRSQISDRDFTRALAAALEESGVLYAVVDRAGDYHLDVHIEALRQPHFAWTMEVQLVTSWSLRRRGEREPLWSGVIDTTHAEPFPAEFFGIRRLRLANEGAARGNIQAALSELARRLP
jgi:hypothetical protein